MHLTQNFIMSKTNLRYPQQHHGSGSPFSGFLKMCKGVQRTQTCTRTSEANGHHQDH